MTWEWVAFWARHLLHYRIALLAMGIGITAGMLWLRACVCSIRGWRYRRKYPDWPDTVRLTAQSRRSIRWAFVWTVVAGGIAVSVGPLVMEFQPIDGIRTVGVVAIQPGGPGTWRISLHPAPLNLKPLVFEGRGTRWYVVGAFMDCHPAVRLLLWPAMHRPLWIETQTSPRALMPRGIAQRGQTITPWVFRWLGRWPGCRISFRTSIPLSIRTDRYLLKVTRSGYVLWPASGQIQSGRRSDCDQ